MLDGSALRAGDDDAAEEALVDAAEDVDGNGVEVVGRLGVGEFFAEFGKAGVVHGEFVRVIEGGVEFEDDAVVAGVELAGCGEEFAPRLAARRTGELLHLDFRLDEFVLQEAEEDEAVESALNKLGEGVAVEGVVGGFEQLGESLAVAFEVDEKRGIDRLLPGAEKAELFADFLWAREFGDVGVEPAIAKGFAGEEVVEFGEFLRVEPLFIMEVADAASERGVDVGLCATVEDVKLLEVGEDGERGACAPAVADGLEGGIGVGFELHSGLLRLAEKAGVAEVWCCVKGVVCTAGVAGDFLWVFDFHLLRVGIALLLVGDIPAERLPQFVDKAHACLRLGVSGGEVVSFVFGEVVDELADGSVGCFECGAEHGGTG